MRQKQRRPKNSGGQYFGSFSRAQVPDGTLESLVEDVPAALQIVRWHVALAFVNARSPRGREASPNYVTLCEGRVSTLARRITLGMTQVARDEVYPARELPDNYGFAFPDQTRPEAAVEVIYQLVLRYLQPFVQASNIHYMVGPAGGEWWARPTTFDDFYRLIREGNAGRAGRRDRPRREATVKVLGRRSSYMTSAIRGTARASS